MPRSYLIVPRPAVKNGRPAWVVTLPKGLHHTKNPKRRFFPTEGMAKQYATELTESKGAIAAMFYNLKPESQEIVLRLLARFGGNAAELERLVEIGVKHSYRSDKLVKDVAGDFIRAQTEKGVGEAMMRNYVATIQKQLAEAFTGTIRDMRSPEIDDWLGRTFDDPRTRNNKRGQVLTFIAWMKDREYLPHDAQFRLTRAIEEAKDVAILTPDQMRKMMEAATTPARKQTRTLSLVPFLAIGGFAGLRVAEICRLHWTDVHLEREQPYIHVPASKVKRVKRTKSRTVPIQANLAAWLKPYVKSDGRIVGSDARNMSEAVGRLAERVGMQWPANAMRHSYASYRVAQTQDETQVATEIGDLVSTMKNHYKLAVDPKLAGEWFSIAPLTESEAVG